MEVFYNRLITARFRGEVADVLCDYRYQLEPDALPIMIQIWDKANRAVFNDMTEVERKPYSISQQGHCTITSITARSNEATFDDLISSSWMSFQLCSNYRTVEYLI